MPGPWRSCPLFALVAFHAIVLAETAGAVAFKHKERGIHGCEDSGSSLGHWLFLVATGLQQYWHMSVEGELACDTRRTEECLELLYALQHSFLRSKPVSTSQRQ